MRAFSVHVEPSLYVETCAGRRLKRNRTRATEQRLNGVHLLCVLCSEFIRTLVCKQGQIGSEIRPSRSGAVSKVEQPEDA
jgi:hypothetical protein